MTDPTTTFALPFERGLIVSCQAPADSPMRAPSTMAILARAAEAAGAVAVRVDAPDDVRAVSDAVSIPVIGIRKTDARDGVYITPSLETAREIVEAGATMVAIDGTDRPRPGGVSLADLIGSIHSELGVAVMADCDSVASAEFAVRAGADAVATTLAGYTSAGAAAHGPDIALVREMSEAVDVPVIAEGRISTPAHAAAALAAGAFAVVVGTAITHVPAVVAGFAGATRRGAWDAPAAPRAVAVSQMGAAGIIQDAIDRVLATQQRSIRLAADAYVRAIDAGGVIQAFGTGHSRGFAMEVAGRAGGLVPANQLAVKDLVFYGGAEPAEILTPEAERVPEIAHRILGIAELHPADCFIIASNSGGNGATVEMAVEAKRRGHDVIAVTSLAHSTRVTSRHPSGRRLFEVADIVIDNGAIFGDAEMALPGGAAIVPVSAVTANLIAEMISAEVSRTFIEREEMPPVLISANIPGGDEHNDAIRARYGDRLRVGEP